MLRVRRRSLHVKIGSTRRYNSGKLDALKFCSFNTGIRGDSKWNHLRDNKVLKNRVGHFIELPELPEPLPKGLKKADLSRYLLTEQRWQILDEVLDSVDRGRLREPSDNGLCLSGPHGVGKSS